MGAPLLPMRIWRSWSLSMVCDASFDSGQQFLNSPDLGAAITFEEIDRDDNILIRTRNSEYRFSVTDPAAHKGMLSGGALGDTPREAVLIESLAQGESGRIDDFRGLKTGARALFYLAYDHRIERVTTSKISSLALIRAANRKSGIS